MRLYRFSPIQTKEQLLEAAGYITRQATRLYFGVAGDTSGCKIEYLTIFSHYDDEYANLLGIAKGMGVTEKTNNGVRVVLSKPLNLKGASIERNGKDESTSHSIKYIRIRKPDPYRAQVGCADFEFDNDSEWDYEQFKDFYGLHTSNPRTIERKDFEMLEFNDPNIDVLAYMLSR